VAVGGGVGGGEEGREAVEGWRGCVARGRVGAAKVCVVVGGAGVCVVADVADVGDAECLIPSLCVFKYLFVLAIL